MGRRIEQHAHIVLGLEIRQGRAQGVIAVAGSIGFVGLAIPHLVRLTMGTDHRRPLPLAALLGAVCLALVDLLSRTLDRSNELPLGILTDRLHVSLDRNPILRDVNSEAHKGGRWGGPAARVRRTGRIGSSTWTGRRGRRRPRRRRARSDGCGSSP